MVASVFVVVSYFHPILIFAVKAEAYSSGNINGLLSKGRLPALPANISLVWYWRRYFNEKLKRKN